MSFIQRNSGVLAVVAIVIAILVGFFALTSQGASVGDFGTRFPNGLAVGSTARVTQNKLTVGNSGNALGNVLFGTCTLWAPANTIAASTTQLVECNGNTTGGLTAISGILPGDKVFVTLGTTTATSNGLVLAGAQASTTANGYITMRLTNLTGATFTWTALASSSVPYLVVR